MPRILRILNRFNIGGPIYNAAYLSKYLAPEYTTLLIGGANEKSEKDALHILHDLEVDYKIIPFMNRSINPLNDLKALRHLEQIIKDFKPDIVHTHASKAGALGRMAASRQNIKVIVHTFHGHVFHSYFSRWKTNIYKGIERYLAKKSHKIIAISPIQKHELVRIHKIANERKVTIIPLGFDLDRFSKNIITKRKLFREKYGLEDDVIAIGTIGRIVPIKNHPLFLSAINHLKSNTTKKWKAFIIGDGESRQLVENEARTLRLKFSESLKDPTDDLHFTSFITEMDEVMAGLDIIVLSSKNEGTPVSLIEAQAAGKPILSTLVGGVANVVISGKTALTNQVTDVNGFHNNLIELVENELLREIFASNGPQEVKRKFHYDRLIKDMKILYSQLLK